MKRFAALLLAGIFSWNMAVSAAAFATNGKAWALSSLEFAYENGFLTEAELQKATSPMSRLEFCKMAMQFLSAITGEAYAPTQPSPFTDCDDADVIAAYEAGLISGTEPGLFEPESSITREQMAILLAHTLGDCGIALPESNTAPFSDLAELYPASAQYISQLSAIGIFAGYADGTFRPFLEMTIQEAAVSFVKAYQYAMEMHTNLPAEKESEEIEEIVEPSIPAETTRIPADIPADTPAPAESPAPEIALPKDDAMQVVLAGYTLFLGMTETELEALCGAPIRIDQTVYECTRYIYQPDATTYFFVTFQNGKAVEFFTPTADFSYRGIKSSSSAADIKIFSYMNDAEHSAVLASENAEAHFPLDYAGNFSGFWLMATDFAETKVPTSSLSQKQTDALEAEFLDIIQAKRAEAGISALKADYTLSTTARAHSKEMVQKRYFGYNSRAGKSPFERFEQAGKRFTTASEVIAKQRGDVVHIYLDWIRTPAKISTLKDPSMQEIGIGIASLTKELYVTIDLCGKNS